METKDATFNGKPIKVVTKLDDDYKDDTILIDNHNDILLNQLNLEDTQKITIGENNDQS